MPPQRQSFSAHAIMALRNIGLTEAQTDGLAAGDPVAFILAGAAEGTVAVARLLGISRLQIGIYTIRNEEGGLTDLMSFEARSHAVARAIGAVEVEMMGVEITNERLRATLEDGGFSPMTFPAPEELGGGFLHAISRVDPVNPIL